MNVGERVRHIDRDDVGTGTLTAKYPNGSADAEFPHHTFTGVSLATFIPCEQYEHYRIQAEEQRRRDEARRSTLLQEIRTRFHFDFLAADSYFREGCAPLISEKDFEKE